MSVLYLLCNKMENKPYNIVGKDSKSSRTSVERDKIDTPSTHSDLLSWLGTGTYIESGGVKLVLWARTSPKDLTVKKLRTDDRKKNELCNE
jgi:hypothetical protein